MSKNYEIAVWVGDIVFNLLVKADGESDARSKGKNAVEIFFHRNPPTNISGVEFESVNTNCMEMTIEDVCEVDDE